MRRQKLLLAISLLARIGTGLISLLVLARGLGPVDYGFIATVFAYSSIAALLTDFGFSVQALRDIGAEPERAGSIIAACIRVKNVLVLGASIVAVVVLFLLDIEAPLRLAGLLLHGSLMVMSYGDLAMVALRGVGRYDAEAFAVVGGAVFYVGIVGGVALGMPAVLPVAVAILIARLLQTAICFAVLRRHVALENCLFGPFFDMARFMRGSSALALDSVLTTASAQIDTILVSAILGLEAAGLYQVVARVAGYVVLPIQVLAGVYMPRLAQQHYRGGGGPLELRMRGEFAAIGLVAGAFMLLVMPAIPPWVFGVDFAVPMAVWMAFGVLVLVRFVTAAFGVALTARRGVWCRVAGQGAGAAVIVVAMPIALGTLGILGAPLVSMAALLVTLAVYWWALRRKPLVEVLGQ
jgi:O-antigen/teichoic acid export membrane protein